MQALAFALGVSAVLPQALGPFLLLALALVWMTSPVQRAARWQTQLPLAHRAVLWAFVLWPLALALARGGHPDTDVRLFHLVRVALVVWVAMRFSAVEATRLVQGLLIGAAWVLVVRVVHEVLPLPPWPIWHKITAAPHDGTQTARIWIMVGVASAICLGRGLQCRQGNPDRSRAWLFAGAALWSTVAAFTVSRNAQIVLVVLPVIALVYTHRGRRFAAVGAIAFVALLAVAWLAVPNVQTQIAKGVQEWHALLEQGDCSTSVGNRWAMYAFTFEQWRASPLWGTGVGSFHELWQAHAAVHCPEWAVNRQPHNDYLLFAMETGGLGLLSLLGFIAVLARSCWAAPSSLFGLTGTVSAWALVLSAAVNSPFRDAGMGFAMLLLLATSAGQCLRQTHPPQGGRAADTG